MSQCHRHLSTLISTLLLLATRPSRTTLAFNIPLFASSKQQRQPTKIFSIDISETAPRDIAPLLQWSTDVGIQYDLTLTTASSDDGKEDVYAVATHDTPASSCVLYVPPQVMLSTKNAAQPFDNSAAQLHPNELPAFSLFTQVLRHYEAAATNGSNGSPYYDYLNSLPRYYTNGASMTDFCFGCLPPYAAGLALEDKNRYEKFVNALESVSDLSDEIKRHRDATRWAYNVVVTRYQQVMVSSDEDGGGIASHNNNGLCLIPLVDYLNHGGVHSNSYVTYDEEGGAYVYTACDVPAGEPLTLCYGDPNNPSALLARYGFLDETSDATYCKYIITNPSYEVRNLGYPHAMLFYKDGSISQEVWDVLLYQELSKVSTDNDGQLANNFYQARINGNVDITSKYHSQYWEYTLFELQHHVNSVMYELEELEIGLVTQLNMGREGVERHPRLMLLTRHNEFIKDIFENVEKNLNTMFS